MPSTDDAEFQTIADPLPEADQASGKARALRELAAWYRHFAERAGNPAIWEARLRMAEDLDAEADRIDRTPNRQD